MKILYAVQATGNGHVSRAAELIPHLRQLGNVDIFLSGNNCHLSLDCPVKYRSNGVSLYFNNTGGLNYWRILRGIHPLTLRKEINELPVEKYDLVINDFEFISAASCAKKKIPSVHLGHQASFQSPLTPRPSNKNALGEWVLKNYAMTTHSLGLHFDTYDSFILPPVIQKNILEAAVVDKGHITVYLPSFSLQRMIALLSRFGDHRFQVFSKEVTQSTRLNNIICVPPDRKKFAESLISCHGIICGAGFETPAEALHLRKKLLCIPTRGQYEQICNAAALQLLGVHCVRKPDIDFPFRFQQWINADPVKTVKYENVIPQILERLSKLHKTMTKQDFIIDVEKQVMSLPVA